MNVTQSTPLTLNLTLDSINAVLAALSSQPYERVVGVINEIQRQATTQLQALQAQQAAEVPNVE